MKEKILRALGKFALDLLYKVTSRVFLAWVTTTLIVWAYIAACIITKDLTLVNAPWANTLLWIWGVVSMFWIGGCVLNDAVAKMVERGNLTIGAGGGR